MSQDDLEPFAVEVDEAITDATLELEWLGRCLHNRYKESDARLAHIGEWEHCAGVICMQTRRRIYALEVL